MSLQLTPALRAEYEQLWQTCEVLPARAGDVDARAEAVLRTRAHYEAVEALIGVPWFVVAAIHSLEAGGRFDRHLHNGDPLTARTVHVPAGRPPRGKPPFTWGESAADALRRQKLDRWTDWRVAGVLYQLEAYNGWGYRQHHADVLTPYLWSFSNHYRRGKYSSDGKWSPTAVSAQCGAAVLLRRLEERGAIVMVP